MGMRKEPPKSGREMSMIEIRRIYGTEAVSLAEEVEDIAQQMIVPYSSFTTPHTIVQRAMLVTGCRNNKCFHNEAVITFLTKRVKKSVDDYTFAQAAKEKIRDGQK